MVHMPARGGHRAEKRSQEVQNGMVQMFLWVPH